MFGKAIAAFVMMLNGQVAMQPQAVKPAPPAAAPAPKAADPAAKPALDANQVVAGVQGYYKTTAKLQASFRQKYTNTVFGKTSVSDGVVYIEKPGKMRWWYKKPDVKHYVSDGTTLWVVEEANKQAFKQSIQDELLPVAITFLYGQGDLAKDFTASLDPGKYGGKGDLVVKLLPKTPSAQYKTLWLVVDPADFHVKESVIQEASDNVNSFAFSNIKLNDKAKNVKASVFQVSEKELKKKGIKIITAPAAKAPATPGPAAPAPTK